jgi:hypothetical protein
MSKRQGVPMGSIRGLRRLSCAALAAVLLAACASQVEPAQRSISDIEAALSAASEEAAKYVPDELAAVRSDLDGLKAAFQQKDYAAVLAGAPAVMIKAQSLGASAAAKKDALMQALNDQWSGIATSLPDEMSAVQSQIDLLAGKKSGKKPAEAIDLDAARDTLSGAVSLWSKAQAAFATGNLPEAVDSAQKVQASVRELESTLKMPSSPAAPAGAHRS